MEKFKFIYLVIAGMLLSCSSETDNTQSENESVIRVGTRPAEKRYYSDAFEFSATLKPFREANVGATIPGRVEKINFAVGEYVSKGAIIIEMSSEPMVMARVEKEAIEKDYNRVKRLREQGSVTQQDYDHVKAKLEASKSKLDLFKNNTRISAPFSGVVAEHLVNEGENFMFSPGLELGLSHTSGIVRLMQFDPLVAAFNVNEKYLRHFFKGMDAEVILDAFPGEVFHSEVMQVGPIVSAMSRSAEVMVKLPNPDRKILPGMFARVSLELPGDTLVFVPRHAVQEDNDRVFVWIIEDGKAVQKDVKPVLSSRGYTALENIEAGDKVIVAGINRLISGASVVE